MNEDQLFTFYASPERADDRTIKEQKKEFEKEPFLSIIANAIPNMLVILNKQRQIVFANRFFLRKLNISDVHKALGLRPGEVLDCIHADEQPGGCGTTEFCLHCGALNAILEAKKNKFFVQECRITTKNGEALDLEVMTTLILRKGSLYTIFAMKDIGDEKRREALERIFFHDVLNSAGGISGLSSILLEEKDPGKLQQITQIIQRTSEYLVEEIKSQQQLFKAEHGDLEVAHTELNSGIILKEVAELYSAHKVSNKRNIVVKEGSPVILFYSDSVLLRRVLGNMIKNALEATPEGGTVELSCKNKNGSVRFCVHNDGFMDDEIQLQVFQRSFTTKGIGRGLGTYGMKLLGEKYLGGKVGFESTEEKGTTFYLELPIKKEKNKT